MKQLLDPQNSDSLYCHYDLIYSDVYQTGYGIAFVFCDDDEDEADQEETAWQA